MSCDLFFYGTFGVSHLVCIQEMSKFEEPDILFNMLNCLKILCLHGECLYLARKDHPLFLAYIQEKMLIPRCVLTVSLINFLVTNSLTAILSVRI